MVKRKKQENKEKAPKQLSEKKQAKLRAKLSKRLIKEGVDPTTVDGKEALEELYQAKITGQKVVNTFKGERGFTNGFGYMDTDAYIFTEDTVMAVFDLLFDYGTNRPAKIGWVTSVIPKSELNAGRITIVERQKMIDETTENEILDKKLASAIATTESTTTDSARESSKNSDRVYDMELASKLAGNDENIIDSDLRVLVKADSPENVEMVIDEMMINYKNANVKGITLVRRVGEQLDELRHIFTEISGDSWHTSDMTTVSAGRLFIPSSGFSDETGAFVGFDRMSLLSRNPAMVDFTGTKNAVIFTGGVRLNTILPDENDNMVERASLNGGSAMAQMIANANYLSGQRTHHIILNKTNIRQSADSLYFDLVNEDAINPLEVFGTAETVEFDANTNFKKVVTMLLLLANVDVNSDPNYSATLMTLLRGWITNRARQGGLYTDTPQLEPHKAQRILATSDHENYPTLEDFVTTLQANVSDSARKGERERERADLMLNSIRETVRAYNSLLAKPTTLPDQYKSSVRNIYYDLSGVKENPRVKGVMFLNLMSYVTNRALRGEVIVIHGLDDIDLPDSDLLVPYRSRIDDKEIGLITVFNKSENRINPGTFRGFVGRLSRQDVVVLGGLSVSELDYINDSWQQPVPQQVTDELLSGMDNIVYVHRERDQTGALIETHLMP
jgi:hypothetical protein